ncbi:yjeF N-terminal domain-containing protein 3-like [Onychostruthus taczanowskii]|uniref:yjeF N-terminal domain-containing protein 3-like n=1 Tax=Onychostruthus taczanowskii TaxID=356909 RepID=UPI001B8005DC|nr:yjeF N-terminal domain-containing protein 3-like [Onychostruthus taczanowskii]
MGWDHPAAWGPNPDPNQRPQTGTPQLSPGSAGSPPGAASERFPPERGVRRGLDAPGSPRYRRDPGPAQIPSQRYRRGLDPPGSSRYRRDPGPAQIPSQRYRRGLDAPGSPRYRRDPGPAQIPSQRYRRGLDPPGSSRYRRDPGPAQIPSQRYRRGLDAPGSARFPRYRRDPVPAGSPCPPPSPGVSRNGVGSRILPGAWGQLCPPVLSGDCPQGSQAEAEAMEKELLEDYRFGRQQLIEIWGHACAVAVTKAFPLLSLRRRQPTLLVACGPGQHGAIGLVCARHLRTFDYEPTIFYPKRSPDPLHRDFTTQCERMDIPFLSYLPAEVTPAPNPGIDPPPSLPPCGPPNPGIDSPPSLFPREPPSRPVPVTLSPGPGWAAGAGGSGDIRPDVLVSLAAPKAVARRFQGRRHFLAGRFVPEELRRKFGIGPRQYPGSDCVVAL